MKKELILFLLIFLSLLGSSVQAVSCDITAATGWWSDIQTTVNQVSQCMANLVPPENKGIVRIPEGRWAFINTTETMINGQGKVTVPAGIDIFGAPTIRGTLNGINNFVIPDPNANAGEPGSAKYGGWKTILYLPVDIGVSGGAEPPFFFMFTGTRINWYDNSKPSRISNIFFEGYRFEHLDSTLEVSPLQMNGVADFRIDHCDFRSLGWGMWIWSHGYPSTSYGVIDHCNIKNDVGVAAWDMGASNVQYGVVCGGTGYYTSGHYWIPNPVDVLGKYTPLSVYIEDCQIGLWRHDIAANDDAHYVVRHCIFDNDTGYSTLDAHGARGSAGRYGTRAVEVYNCTFKNVDGDYYLGQLFSGATVFHNNKVGSDYKTLYLGNDSSPYFDYAYLWNNRKIDANGNDIGPMTINPTIQGGVESLIFLNTQMPDYFPYPYPHPLTLETSNLKTISGKLLDKNSQPINVNIIAYQNGTNNIVNSIQTNSSGHYLFQVPNGTYDIQFNLTSIPNYYIKLNSVNLTSDKTDILNYINYSSQKISFVVDFNDSQRIEIYSSSDPTRVLKNGSVITNVSSLPELNNNTWFYIFSEQKLYMIVSIEETTSMIDGLPSANYYVIESGGTYTAMNSSGQTIMTGINAATVINYILNMMTSGQKVAFQGTFSLLTTISPKSNTTLLFGTATFAVDAMVSNLMTLSSGAANITFDGGFFDANGNCNYFINGYGYSSITVQNGDFQGFTYDVLAFTHASGGSQGNHLIQYNNFHDAIGSNGAYITLNYASNCKILYNTFGGPSGGDHGIGIFGPAYGYNEIAYNTMVGSSGHEIYTTTPNMFIHDNEFGAGSGDGILIKAKAYVYNNYIHDRGAWAITAYWWEGGTSNGDLTGSRIYNNRIENTLDALVIRPTRGMDPELTVTLKDVEYFNNTISGGTGAAFRFISIAYQVSNITFQCNKVSNKPYGARIDASSSMINGINFLKNTFESVPTTFSIGTGASNTTIAYNNVTNANATVMLQDSGTNTMVYDNIPAELLADKNVPPVKIPQPPQC